MIFIEENKIKEHIIDLLKDNERFCIDRIEDNLAVCENIDDGKLHNVPLEKLPKNIKEKDIIVFKNKRFEMDNSFLSKRSEIIKEKTKNLWI